MYMLSNTERTFKFISEQWDDEMYEKEKKPI